MHYFIPVFVGSIYTFPGWYMSFKILITQSKKQQLLAWVMLFDNRIFWRLNSLSRHKLKASWWHLTCIYIWDLCTWLELYYKCNVQWSGKLIEFYPSSGRAAVKAKRLHPADPQDSFTKIILQMQGWTMEKLIHHLPAMRWKALPQIEKKRHSFKNAGAATS